MFPCVSLTSTDDPNPLPGFQKTQQLLRTSRTCPPSNEQKTHTHTHTGDKRASISTKNTQFGLFSVVGWATQKFTKRQEQANLLLLREKGLTSDAHWEMDFDLWESSVAQKTRNTHVNVSAKIRLFWLFRGQKMDFSRHKPTFGTGLHRIAAQNAAELPQNSATHSPKKCKTDQILPACVQKKHFFKICPKFLGFCRSKKSGAKCGQGVF